MDTMIDTLRISYRNPEGNNEISDFEYKQEGGRRNQ